MFGEIAIAFGYIDDRQLMRYVESDEEKARIGKTQEA